MRLVLMIIISILMFEKPVYSTSVCVDNNAYIGILRKSVNGTSTAYNNTLKAWKVVFDYKTITGLAACNEISGTFGQPKTNLYTDASDTGTYCWCKMEPVVDTSTGGLGTSNPTGISSYWVYAYDYATAVQNNPETECANDCASRCATLISNNTNDFRIKVFEAIW